MAVKPHSFDPLSAEEIAIIADVVRSNSIHEVFFRVITIIEPPIREMVVFLDDEHTRKPSAPLLRRAINKASPQIFVDVKNRKAISHEVLKGKHSHVDTSYIKEVRTEHKALNLPERAEVNVESWIYVTDGTNDMSSIITVCWFYMRLSNHEDANYYAYPLDIVCGSSAATSKTFDQQKVHTSSHTIRLLPPPPINYPTLPNRSTQGPLFQIGGNHINWGKWTTRLDFNYREGTTLHDNCYDNRSLSYRLSLSECAFDLGTDGAGVNANNLKLGCNRLGHIEYFDFRHTASSSEPLRMQNVHTNFRTGNAVVTRASVLVLQTIIKVSNYEYVSMSYFGQGTEIRYEVRATGIVSTAPIEMGEKVPFGTAVAPGVPAPYHQPLFCLRIDPTLDEHQNSLVMEESVPMNFPGVGYTTQSTIVEEERPRVDRVWTGPKTGSSRLVNENKINMTTGAPTSFKLVPYHSQPLLAHPSSFHARRSEFGAHAMWVTRHSDSKIYTVGIHTMQSLSGEGIASWIASRQATSSSAFSSARNEDIVLWHTFGSIHNLRIKDCPVMPHEIMSIVLKPVNFLD
ncbi:amine oxidase catalytic domain-containing protein [Byssothecium circinans]|uniref:Amine oxidase n=1 Tax=Byssothecium circinans TaxID=147558 RepID=A0A6A5T5B2_9PLEO|nr:amine oxidase catalytic domain-containing protein [Byssothecium circinans]